MLVEQKRTPFCMPFIELFFIVVVCSEYGAHGVTISVHAIAKQTINSKKDEKVNRMKRTAAEKAMKHWESQAKYFWYGGEGERWDSCKESKYEGRHWAQVRVIL